MRTGNAIIYLASFVVVAAGLKTASVVVLPFLMAVFIAIVATPAINALEKLKFPRVLAFALVTAVVFLSLGFIANTVIKTINGLVSYMPELQSKFKALADHYHQMLASRGLIDPESIAAPADFDINKIFAVLGGFLRSGTELVSKSFFVFLLVTFMLFEVQVFSQKVEYFASKNPQTNQIVDTFISNLKRYLAIKSAASFATGVFIFIGLNFIGVPYAPLWGILAFVLNKFYPDDRLYYRGRLGAFGGAFAKRRSLLCLDCGAISSRKYRHRQLYRAEISRQKPWYKHACGAFEPTFLGIFVRHRRYVFSSTAYHEPKDRA